MGNYLPHTGHGKQQRIVKEIMGWVRHSITVQFPLFRGSQVCSISYLPSHLVIIQPECLLTLQRNIQAKTGFVYYVWVAYEVTNVPVYVFCIQNTRLKIIALFWNVSTCSLVERCPVFVGICCLQTKAHEEASRFL